MGIKNKERTNLDMAIDIFCIRSEPEEFVFSRFGFNVICFEMWDVE